MEHFLKLFQEEERNAGPVTSQTKLQEKFGIDKTKNDKELGSNPPTTANSLHKSPNSNIDIERVRSSSMSLGSSRLGRKSKGDFDMDMLT